MKIIRAKELTMPLTAGEEANCSTEHWAQRIRKEGQIHPRASRAWAARGGTAPVPKGRLWPPWAGSQRQEEPGRSC